MAGRLDAWHHRRCYSRLMAVLVGTVTLGLSAVDVQAAPIGLGQVTAVGQVTSVGQVTAVGQVGAKTNSGGAASSAAKAAMPDGPALEASEPEPVAAASSAAKGADLSVAGEETVFPADPAPDTTVEGTIDVLSGAPPTDFSVSAVAVMDASGTNIVAATPVAVVILADGSFVFPALTDWVYQITIDKAGQPMEMTSNLGPYTPGLPDPTMPVPAWQGTSPQVEADGGTKGIHITIIDAEILTWIGLAPLKGESPWGQGIVHQTAGQIPSVAFSVARSDATVRMGDITSFDPIAAGWIDIKPVKGADNLWRMTDAPTEAKLHRITVWVHYEGAIFRYGFVVAIEPDEIASITIQPDRDEIKAGETVCFGITTKDAYGNLIPFAPSNEAAGLTSSRSGDTSTYDKTKNQICTTFGDGDGTNRIITYTNAETGVAGTTTVKVDRGLAITGSGRYTASIALVAAGLMVIGAGLVCLRSRGGRSTWPRLPS